MKRALQTEMTGGSFDCFQLVSDYCADPFQQQAERDASRRIMADLHRAQLALGISEPTNNNAVNAGTAGGK